MLPIDEAIKCAREGVFPGHPRTSGIVQALLSEVGRLAARVAELEAAMNQLLGAGWSIEGGGVIAIDGAMTVAMLAETVAEAKGESP